MDASTAGGPVSVPSYFVNYTSGVVLASFPANSSRSQLLTVLSQTTPHSTVSGQNNEPNGGKGTVSDNDSDEDSFGEHYFHICIYIWACVVVSSLIALSVVIFHIAVIQCQKWGCCGRSLTRWELRKIPLKRFQRVDGDDYQEKCPICHEEFHEGRLIRQLPCNHCYHSYCVDRWLMKMSNRCPLCKQRVSISLFCPWNKQRRKKEIFGHMASDAEADSGASVEESPPLPPLATLTPNSWYGEAIMSGPSKLIIMRPGRPTRVIDIREQKAKARASPKEITRARGGKLGEVEKSPGKNFDDITTEHDSDSIDQCDANEFLESLTSTQNGHLDCGGDDDDDDDDDLFADAPIPSACSSRSSSISSDHPLLVESLFHMQKDRATHKDILPLTRQSVQLCRRFYPTCGDGVHIVPLLSSTEDSQVTTEHSVEEPNTSSDATVTLSFGSSSVVSCNYKIQKPDLDSKSHKPSTPTEIVAHSSSSSEKPMPFPKEGYRIIADEALVCKKHTLPAESSKPWCCEECGCANKNFTEKDCFKQSNVVDRPAGYS